MLEFRDTQIEVGAGRPRLRANFCVYAGQRVLLAGPNGSGKTSLLDAVIGLRELSSGHVDLQTSKPVAYVVQDTLGGLLPWKTVEENILLPAALCLVESEDQDKYRIRCLHLLQALQVEGLKGALPYRISGGERQIMNLIRGACTPSDLILLDEPFAALHARTRHLVMETIVPIFEGKTILMVSHDPDDLDLGFDRFFLLEDATVKESNRAYVQKFLETVS